MIGTNKKDATETADLLLADAAEGLLPRSAEPSGRLDELLAQRGVDSVMYAGWEAIDALERDRGAGKGRPRIKLCTWDELLEAAGGAKV